MDGYLTYRGVMPVELAWIRPNDGVSGWYVVYAMWRAGDEPVFCGGAAAADLAPHIFADWRAA